MTEFEKYLDWLSENWDLFDSQPPEVPEIIDVPDPDLLKI